MRELPPPPPAQRASKESRLALPAPVIRGAAGNAPVLRISADDPLPQFTLWADDKSDTEKTTKRPTPQPPFVAAAIEVSDADVTLPRPSRLPNFQDEAHFDWAPTLKKAALTPSDAAAVLLAKRFRATTQLGGSDAPKREPAKKADTLRPVVAAADSTEELDLDEIEELPVDTARDTVVDLSSKHLVDTSAEIRLDFADDAIPLVPDTTLEVMALQRRRRVRKMGSRMIAGIVAVGVLVLGIGGVRLGFRDLASSLEITYTTPSMRDAQASAPKTQMKKETEPKVAPPVVTATATVAPKPTTAPLAKPTTTPKTIATSTPKSVPTPKAAPLPPKKPATKTGTLHTPAGQAGHRVYVDGFLSGFAPNPITLKCGSHSVKVGSAGKVQTVNVPCGGDAWAK